MNLSPSWVKVLKREGHEVVHWSTIGKSTAPDEEILEWAKLNEHVVLTQDLDFGEILSATHAESPSVLLIREQDIMPIHIGPNVIELLKKHEIRLTEGALIVFSGKRERVRILPI